MASQFEEMIGVLQESENTVVLAGAGISKAAGIPTFRDLDDGLWRDEENLVWAHRATFDADLQEWYVKFWKFYDRRVAAAPTIAHHALKDMVDASVISTIVTQNIDGLDLLAGTDEDKVIEVHGHDRLLSCTDVRECGYFVPTGDWVAENDREGLPKCPRDEQPLKPDVLLFDDELVPPELITNFLKGLEAIGTADALLVIGTTLEIASWNEAVYAFGKMDEKPVISINPNRSRADRYAKFIIHETADVALPVIRDHLVK